MCIASGTRQRSVSAGPAIDDVMHGQRTSQLQFSMYSLCSDQAALMVVSNARRLSVALDVRMLGPIGVQLRFRHFVRFGSSLVPDALMPWDGSPQPAEQQNQPVSVEMSVPYGTKPGTYRGS